MIVRFKGCFCHNCQKHFHHMGIMRHRAMHRDKQEDCTITYTNDETLTHEFSKTKRYSIRGKINRDQ